MVNITTILAKKCSRNGWIGTAAEMSKMLGYRFSNLTVGDRINFTKYYDEKNACNWGGGKMTGVITKINSIYLTVRILYTNLSPDAPKFGDEVMVHDLAHIWLP